MHKVPRRCTWACGGFNGVRCGSAPRARAVCRTDCGAGQRPAGGCRPTCVRAWPRGPWVAGVLHDLTGNYESAFWVAMSCSVLSAAAIWLAAPRRVRVVGGRLRRQG